MAILLTPVENTWREAKEVTLGGSIAPFERRGSRKASLARKRKDQLKKDLAEPTSDNSVPTAGPKGRWPSEDWMSDTYLAMWALLNAPSDEDIYSTADEDEIAANLGIACRGCKKSFPSGASFRVISSHCHDAHAVWNHNG